MPALGESVTEGTVTRWLKNVGDSVAVDEALLEVSTDKVDTEIPSPVAGVITSIDVPADTTVAVGARLAVIGGVQASGNANVAPVPPVVPTPAPVVSAPISNVNVAQVPPVVATPAVVAVTPARRQLHNQHMLHM
jgi:2-oxoglutarate dehydrogenase E2 component (dihydrolipoamide succinyltransferase)